MQGSHTTRWDLADGSLVLIDRWLDAARADAALTALLAEVAWAQGHISMFGREVAEPRLTAWYGDAGAVYIYSGRRNEPAPWTPRLAELRDAVAAESGRAFNSVLLNLYRDGNDSMGMHADREPELGAEPFIASLSLGATRTFRLRHRRKKEPGLDLELSHGALLLMGGRLQHEWRHGVPKQPRVTEPRINATFRWVDSGCRSAADASVAQ